MAVCSETIATNSAVSSSGSSSTSSTSSGSGAGVRSHKSSLLLLSDVDWIA